MKSVYLDHAATSPVSEAALAAMLPCFREIFGNPSAIHSQGQAARTAVEKARRRVAESVGALRTEVVFTSGGTESDNWALRGACAWMKGRGRHIVASAIEHSAVLRTLEALEAEGFEVTLVAPDALGQVSPARLEDAMRPDTVLVSVMLANNAVGTVLDIPALSAVARRHRALFHTDAVQAAGRIPLDIRALGADFLSLSAHKFGGPKGVGALVCRLPVRIRPMIAGGGQEKGLRSGTENVPGIVGMAAALEESAGALQTRGAALRALGDRFTARALAIPGVRQTGDPVRRLPGFCSFVVDGIGHSALLVNEMNARGYCVSAGSACSAGSQEASHVLLAMGYDAGEAKTALRVTLGPENTRDEVDGAAEALRDAVAALRARRGELTAHARGTEPD